MDILSIIMLILFIVIPVVVILVSVLLGFKRNIFQAVAKLLMTILAVIVSMFVVKLVIPCVASDLLSAGSGILGDEFSAILNGADAASDLIGLVSTLFMPAGFFVVFAVVSFVFSLLYLIPKKLLANITFPKKNNCEQKTTFSIEETDKVVIPEELVEEAINDTAEGYTTVNAENEKQGRSICWPSVALRAGTVMCSAISSLLILAFLATPLNYYPNAINALTDLEGSNDSVVVIKDATDNVYQHPVNLCYRFFNNPVVNFLDNYTTKSGASASALETVETALSLVDTLSTMENMEQNDSAELFYTLAEKLEKNAVLDSILTGFLHDIMIVWNNNESYMGIEPIKFGSETITSKVYDIFLNCDSVAPAFRLAGDVMSLQKVMQGGSNTSDESGKDVVKQIFDSINEESLDMLTEIVSKDVLVDVVGLPPESAESYSNLIGSVLGGVVAIKEDADMTDNEKTTLLEKEAVALTTFINIVQNPEDVEAEDMITNVVDSKILSNTVCEITDNGTKEDPYDIGDSITPEFVEDVKFTLSDKGVVENSELYNSVLALIGG